MDTILDEGMDTLDMDTRGVIHPHTHTRACTPEGRREVARLATLMTLTAKS